MNRNAITLTVMMFAALAVAGCKDGGRRGSATPVATPEVISIEPGSVVVVDPSILAEVTTPDFSGSVHEETCVIDHLGLALGLVESGMTSEAIVELERGVFDDPDSFEIRRTLGDLYLSTGAMELAIGHLRAASEEVDDASTLQVLAQAYFDLKDYDAAAKTISKIVRVDPTNPEPFRLLARVYQNKAMWKESIEACEEAIARGFDSPWTYNNMGFAHLILGAGDDAVRELEKAVSFDEGVTPRMWNNLGLAYEKTGQIVDAAGAYRAALAGDPMYVKAKVNLARTTEIAKAQGIAIGERTAEMATPDVE